MTDSIDKTPRMWRVVLGDGRVRGVAVRRETATMWYAWTPHSDAKCRASTERFAVTRYVARLGWETAEILAPGESSRADLTRERDAALAAVDAVRADYAPRREPPTDDEVRAVSRLWGRDHAARCVAWRSDEHGRWSESWNTGGFSVEVKASPNTAYMLFGPNGPVSWSELAALVAEVRRG